METIWILGDQLGRHVASLEGVRPGEARILFVESRRKAQGRRWHRQRLHLVWAGMRRFAQALGDEGFEVDYRFAESLPAGLAEHRARHRPQAVRAMEPLSWRGLAMLRAEGVETLRSNQMLCHAEEFSAWAGDRKRLRMEDFYRWQRRRLGVLMDGDAPAGGRWNFDAENREPPPVDGDWPAPPRSRLDQLDHDVVAALPSGVFGAEPDGTWATHRRGALARLRHFVREVLPAFGPHQDAMTERSWHLGHSLLSPYLNLGMLQPREVVAAAERAYREGAAPIASVEGFVRQVIGWREFVWGVYWRSMPGMARANALRADRPLPVAFRDPERTRMRCLRSALHAVEAHGYAHHIQRLMVLGNLSLLAGVRPAELVDWMGASFVDGAEWVMIPNVVGMALHADGGAMTTKPYAAGGAYVNRMSDHCRGCHYDPKRRSGADACPLSSLYWDFMARHRQRFAGNPRMQPPLRTLGRLQDLDEVRRQARRVRKGLERGSA